MLVEDIELLRNLLVMSLSTSGSSLCWVSLTGVAMVTGVRRGGSVIGTRLPSGGEDEVEGGYFEDGDTFEEWSLVLAVVSHGGGGSWVVTVVVLVKVVT